ncbi:MAG: nuclear transport factor 2 family protein [Acidimicrobiales bacterium]
MTTPTITTDSAAAEVPRFSVAGEFLEALANQDFERLGSALSDDVRMRGLLPSGSFEWTGTDTAKSLFARWFGNTQQFELVDAVVGDVGQRLYLRWRLRLQAERLGAGWHVVEQQAYADTDDSDRIRNLSILCSGYCAERGDA